MCVRVDGVLKMDLLVKVPNNTFCDWEAKWHKVFSWLVSLENPFLKLHLLVRTLFIDIALFFSIS